jgi:hypothetical protein
MPGWYADPSDAAQLRWWDGSTWTGDTRAQIPHTAPPPPGGPSGDTTGGYATPGPGTTSGYATPGPPTTSGYATPGPGSSGPQFTYGFGAGTAGAGPGSAAPADESSRSWLSWASIGAAIAVALAVIIVLSVSLLGHRSNVSSSQGLVAPTTTGGPGASTATTPTSVAPSTTLNQPPPDSTPFTDPAGVYSISVNPAWEPPPTSIGGIQLWYLTGVNYGGYRSNLTIITETLPAAESLPTYVQQTLQGLTRSATVHVNGTTNITLADGTGAVVLSYSESELGDAVSGHATLAVHGTHAVVVTVVAAADAAPTTFSLVNPYVATLHIN